MRVLVHISLKSAVLDPQGKAVSEALQRLGFDEVVDARVGRTVELALDEPPVPAEASALLEDPPPAELPTEEAMASTDWASPALPSEECRLPTSAESSEPSGPFGAKAVAEIPKDGVAPAVRNAILNATGVRIDKLPFTPERVYSAMRAH